MDKEAIPPGIKKKISRNKRNAKNKKKEKFGIKILNSTTEALLLDKANRDDKWGEAIAKEMGALERLNVFEYLNPNTKFWREEGWQFPPMQMIFDIKQDLHRKVRFVVGGHVIDSSEHMTYSSMIKDVSVWLLMLAAVKMVSI